MTFTTELYSWLTPTSLPLDSIPAVGDQAPSTPKLSIPAADGQPTVVTFLRHCGCPFAEKTFLNLRTTATAHPSIHFLAVSHSDRASTDRWLASLASLPSPPSSTSTPSSSLPPNLTLIVDAERESYAAWGLGTSGWWHVLSSLSSAKKLEREEGIKIRDTESGSRWQMGGCFAVDGRGVVRWGRGDGWAGDVPDFGEAVGALG